MAPAGAPRLVTIKDLRVQFRTFEGLAEVVDVHSLEIRRGETLGLAGESGSGKTVTALSIFKLVPVPPGRIASGEIWFEDQNVLALREERLRAIRGRDMAMIFQDPMSSLNPVLTVGDQMVRVLRRRGGLSTREAMQRAIAHFEEVQLPDPATTFGKYPHELSGGMRQRVVIAMALACGARFLVADEPTRALDVTIQAGILDLLRRLSAREGITMLLIANNLGVVSQMCDRVALLYAGQIVEIGTVEEVFSNPAHPYTRALIAAIPTPERKETKLAVTGGFPPNPVRMPPGCRFHPRCTIARKLCATTRPDATRLGGDHRVWCHAAAGEVGA